MNKDIATLKKENIQSLGSLWGMAIGLLIGLVAGMLTQEWAICIAIGPGFGMAIGISCASWLQARGKPNRFSENSIRLGLLLGSGFLMLLFIVAGMIVLA